MRPLHRYRSHTCGALRAADVGKDVRLSGWVHRMRDHGGLLFIDLRDHYGLTQVRRRPRQPGLQGGRDGALRVGDPRRRQGARAARGHRQPEAADRRGRGVRRRDRGAVGGRGAAAAGVRRAGLSGGPAAAATASSTCAARRCTRNIMLRCRDHRLDPPAHDEAGLHRVPDADPDRVARPRARATSWCRRACTRASSTRCRRRRSSSSSC